MEKTTQTLNNNELLAASSLLKPWDYNFYATALFLIAFFGFNFNLIALLLICKNKLWTPMNIILMNLLASDFCVSFLGTPWSFLAAVYRGWPFGHGLCISYAFLMAVSGELLRCVILFAFIQGVKFHIRYFIYYNFDCSCGGKILSGGFSAWQTSH